MKTLALLLGTNQRLNMKKSILLQKDISICYNNPGVPLIGNIKALHPIPYVNHEHSMLTRQLTVNNLH